MKAYLITFTSPSYPIIERKTILDFLDTQSVIKNWYAVMPNAILVATEVGIPEITTMLTNRFPQNFTYLVTDASQANGLANSQVWSFINTPTSSGRWP